jgi:hypothetical protein
MICPWRRITPPLRAIGTFGPTVVAPLALLVGVYNPAVTALLLAGYLNLFLAVLLRPDSAPIHRSRVGQVARAIQPTTVVVGAILAVSVAVNIVYLYATVLLFPLAIWIRAGNGVRTCRKVVQG